MNSSRACVHRSRPSSCVVGICLSLALAGAAHAERFEFDPVAADPTALDLSRVGLAAVLQSESSPQATGESVAEPQDARLYGAADSMELEISIGPAFDFDGTTLGIAGVGVHWFVADGVSLGVLAEGLWFDDGASDAFGGGAALVARWHFVRERDHSFFIEGGCGFAGFSDDVPSGGTDYDFTPRVALGFTYALDDGVRLVGRAGWFHISNGQTGPGNPGLDSASISLGLSFTLGD
jgi:hypothetical protein